MTLTLDYGFIIIFAFRSLIIYYYFLFMIKSNLFIFSHTRSLSIKFSILYADIIKLYSKSWTKWKWKKEEKKNWNNVLLFNNPSLILCLTANNPNITKEWWCHISSGKSSTKIAKFFFNEQKKNNKIWGKYTQSLIRLSSCWE